MDRPARDALRRALAEAPPPRVEVEGAALQPAAVLVLVYSSGGEDTVLLSRRSEALEEHPGEISFPGGRREAADASPLDTALREAREEVGVDPADVEVLGELGRFSTLSDYEISAFVGAVDAPYEFAVSSAEVDALIEVPLAELMHRRGLRDDVRIVGDDLTVMPSFAHGGSVIFGATARMLDRLIEVYAASRAREAA